MFAYCNLMTTVNLEGSYLNNCGTDGINMFTLCHSLIRIIPPAQATNDIRQQIDAINKRQQYVDIVKQHTSTTSTTQPKGSISEMITQYEQLNEKEMNECNELKQRILTLVENIKNRTTLIQKLKECAPYE